MLEAAGSVLTNKYAEGYPGKRYYGGCEFVDVVERAAIARAKALFGAEHANVQPHSGAQANMAVYLTLLKPGDTVLGMNLAHGGHLTHGHPLNFSGKLYTIVPYGVRKDDERIDYDELDRLADEHKPKMIIVGASAYPRVIDFARIRAAADRIGAADVHRHGAHRRPGRRRRASEPGAALRLRHDDDAQDAARTARRHGAVPRAVREGSRSQRCSPACRAAADAHHRGQGGLLQGSGRAGVRRLPAADRRQRRSGSRPRCRRAGFRLVSGGTDNHLMLVDVFSKGITGKVAEAALGKAGITVNKNAIPFDQNPPMVASGIRIGTPAVTTRGMREAEMELIGELHRARARRRPTTTRALGMVRAEVEALCRKFPLYPELSGLDGARSPRSSRPTARWRARCPTSSRAPARSRWPRASRACSRTAASCSPRPAPAPARRSPISCRRSSAASAC